MREINAVLKGESARLRRQHNEVAWGAWHIAALDRMKKLPDLKKMLSDRPNGGRRQTVEEQIAIAKQWTAALSRKR